MMSCFLVEVPVKEARFVHREGPSLLRGPGVVHEGAEGMPERGHALPKGEDQLIQVAKNWTE